MGRLSDNDVTVRRAGYGDIAALRKIEEESFSHPPYTETIMSTESFAAIIGDEDNQILLAEAGGRILGYVWFGPEPGETGSGPALMIGSIAVRKAARGMGLASRLVREAEARLAEALRREGMDAAHLFAEVYAGNEASLGLFRSMGYMPVRNLPDFYGPSNHAVLLRKGLFAVPAPSAAPGLPVRAFG